MQTILNIAGLENDSIVDGPGLRFTVFCQGCDHDCEGCHNPSTHPFDIGTDYTVAEIVSKIQINPLIKGVTFSGGDPMYQAAGFAELGRKLKELGYEIACYTGFTWEYLISVGTPDQIDLLKTLDILIDGPFILSLRNIDLKFRGSSNQRIIDVPKSLETAKIGITPASPPILTTQKRWIGEKITKLPII